MANFIGEFECKIDPKGRIMLPAALKKQISPEAHDKFVVNRGFEKCLVLYPSNEWTSITSDLNQLNLYNKKNREFVRYFYSGATELEMDNTNRLLIPKRLQEYASIDKEIILFAYSNRIEIWDKNNYEQMIAVEPDNFSTLAEEVMGKKDKAESND